MVELYKCVDAYAAIEEKYDDKPWILFEREIAFHNRTAAESLLCKSDVSEDAFYALICSGVVVYAKLTSRMCKYTCLKKCGNLLLHACQLFYICPHQHSVECLWPFWEGGARPTTGDALMDRLVMPSLMESVVADIRSKIASDSPTTQPRISQKIADGIFLLKDRPNNRHIILLQDSTNDKVAVSLLHGLSDVVTHTLLTNGERDYYDNDANDDDDDDVVVKCTTQHAGHDFLSRFRSALTNTSDGVHLQSYSLEHASGYLDKPVIHFSQSMPPFVFLKLAYVILWALMAMFPGMPMPKVALSKRGSAAALHLSCFLDHVRKWVIAFTSGTSVINDSIPHARRNERIVARKVYLHMCDLYESDVLACTDGYHEAHSTRLVQHLDTLPTSSCVLVFLPVVGVQDILHQFEADPASLDETSSVNSDHGCMDYCRSAFLGGCGKIVVHLLDLVCDHGLGLLPWCVSFTMCLLAVLISCEYYVVALLVMGWSVLLLLIARYIWMFANKADNFSHLCFKDLYKRIPKEFPAY